VSGDALVGALHNKLTVEVNAIRTDLAGLDSTLNSVRCELMARMDRLEERVRQIEADVRDLKEKLPP
jgi:hypothetical protein